jgi:N-acylglucosamine 2-epimerase
MDSDRIDELVSIYRDGLLEDVEPFWTRYAIDRNYGGYLTCLDRDGTVFSTDKNIWMTGRMVWFYARLYNRVEKRSDWLDYSLQGAEFLLEHCFDGAGRMYENVSREGRPLSRAGNPYGMCFAAMGLAELTLASGKDWARERAIATYDLFISDLRIEECTESAERVLGKRMIQLSMTPSLEQIDDRPVYQKVLKHCIDEVFKWYYRPEMDLVLEYVGRNGEVLDSRLTLCPGKALETAWFIIDEGRRRGDIQMAQRAIPLVKSSLEKGWDEEYGGLFLLTDLNGKGVSRTHGKMKYWWPQVEGLCAALMAYAVTGDPYWEVWFERLHTYIMDHFPDSKFGEWYGYLNRDGTPAPGHTGMAGGDGARAAVKGSLNKCAFHLMRSQMACWKGLEAIKQGRGMAGEWISLR